MFDRRKLTSDGVGSPIHKFEGHSAAVLCVQVSMLPDYIFRTEVYFFFFFYFGLCLTSAIHLFPVVS